LIIAGSYCAAFACSAFDRSNAAATLLRAAGATPTRLRLQLAFAIGALVVALAAALRTWASAYLPSAVVHDVALHHERLVADGPYRFVRNPLYLGNILMAAGMGLMASRAGFLLLVLGQTLFYRRLLGREEAELLAAQGASYGRYLAAVPRLVPSPFPRIPPSGNTPVWGQAFLGEAFFWIFAAAEASFALTLRWSVTGWFMAAALVVYYAAVAIQRRPRAERPAAAGR
jgi:protein-S-isoprenylcysteine O-methyltransferase Ste14